MVPQPVAQQVEAQDREHEGQAGEEHDVRRAQDRPAPLGDHGAPFRRGGLRPQAQEAQPGRLMTVRAMSAAHSSTLYGRIA